VGPSPPVSIGRYLGERVLLPTTTNQGGGDHGRQRRPLQLLEKAVEEAAEEKKVIFASSLGTVFEWYDFYLYATLAPFFAALFFPQGNETAALLSAFATYAAGFLVRPFGAIVFGRIGDLVGRKYTFLVTILVHGRRDLPGRPAAHVRDASAGRPGPAGDAAPGAGPGARRRVRRRGDLRGEHAPHGKRGYDTAWIQTTATLGFFLALAVIGCCRVVHGRQGVRRLGLARAVLALARPAGLLGLHPAQAARVAGVPEDEGRGQGSKSPLTDSFLRYPNNKYVLLALLGATAGQGVVWYTGQFYALFFLTITLKLDYLTAYMLIGASLLLGTPFFIFFGWLSDKIGRLKIILAGCLIAALTYFPLFQASRTT
jgi:Na+/melibiose symporter-like transporter